MSGTLRQNLITAQGRSEFVVSVVCDIRGFSQFSTVHESPDLAMFIKRFYLQLLDRYFADCVFAKPTGDGLLLIFNYTEQSLPDVAEQVLIHCHKAISDFPKMFADDPMINFGTPNLLGFGIARGTACCLYSGKNILDYSGQLLNLTARLTDLARPQGVVIDGSFLEGVIPESLRPAYRREMVYVRSISEDSPRPVYASNLVTIPSYAKFPIATHQWVAESTAVAVADMKKLSPTYAIKLKREPQSLDKIKVELHYRNKRAEGFERWREYKEYRYVKDAHGNRIMVNLERAKSMILEDGLIDEDLVTFAIQYVPKKRKRNAR